MTCFVKKEITQLALDGWDFLVTVNFSFIRRFLNLMCKIMAMDITHVRGELQCIRKVLDSILWVRASVSPEHFHIPENSIEIMNTRSRPGLAVALGIFFSVQSRKHQIFGIQQSYSKAASMKGTD